MSKKQEDVHVRLTKIADIVSDFIDGHHGVASIQDVVPENLEGKPDQHELTEAITFLKRMGVIEEIRR